MESDQIIKKIEYINSLEKYKRINAIQSLIIESKNIKTIIDTTREIIKNIYYYQNCSDDIKYSILNLIKKVDNTQIKEALIFLVVQNIENFTKDFYNIYMTTIETFYKSRNRNFKKLITIELISNIGYFRFSESQDPYESQNPQLSNLVSEIFCLALKAIRYYKKEENYIKRLTKGILDNIEICHKEYLIDEVISTLNECMFKSENQKNTEEINNVILSTFTENTNMEKSNVKEKLLDLLVKQINNNSISYQYELYLTKSLVKNMDFLSTEGYATIKQKAIEILEDLYENFAEQQSTSSNSSIISQLIQENKQCESFFIDALVENASNFEGYENKIAELAIDFIKNYEAKPLTIIGLIKNINCFKNYKDEIFTIANNAIKTMKYEEISLYLSIVNNMNNNLEIFKEYQERITQLTNKMYAATSNLKEKDYSDSQYIFSQTENINKEINTLKNNNEHRYEKNKWRKRLKKYKKQHFKQIR